MRRTALLVLGMHRSGTSALTGTLIKLGVTGPKHPMGSKADNPAGFWESEVFFEYHNRLLSSAGTEWWDWSAIEPSSLEQVAAPFISEFPKLLQQEFDDTSLLVIKDPRISRFVPFTVARLDALGIEAKAVIAIRNPLEVAESLHARDAIEVERGLLIWLRHNLDAEYATRRLKRSFVTYDRLLASWRDVVTRIADELAVHWPRTPSESGSEIDAYLSDELRHHRSQEAGFDSDPRVFGWVKRSYLALRALAEEPAKSQEASQALDEIREQFDTACRVFAPLARPRAARPAMLRCLGVDPIASSDLVPRFHVDFPQAGTLIEERFEVAGWALGRAPYVPHRVHLYSADEVVASGAIHVERPDVARDHPGWPDALRSGFRIGASAHRLPNRFVLLVVIELKDQDGAGFEQPIAHLICERNSGAGAVNKVTAPKSRPSSPQPAIDFSKLRRIAGPDAIRDFFIDRTGQEDAFFFLEGWVLAEAGYVAQRVELRCNGRLLDSAAISLPRPDVAKAHPGMEATSPGFRLRALTELLPSSFLLTLSATLVDHAGTRIERRFAEVPGKSEHGAIS